MGEVLIEAFADVRAALYGSSVEKIRLVAGKALTGFDPAKASRVKVLHELEKYLGNLDKETDGGLSILKEILATLDTKFSVLASSSASGAVATLKKEFKLSGIIGEGPSCLGYMSFMRQVESASKKGYSEREIVDGVIRAIQASSKLRGYLEGRDELDLPVLQAIIRAYYKEKSSTELYQELCNLNQTQKETTQEFIFRSLELRQKIIFASKEPGKLNYDPELVEKQFQHSVITGVRDESIKNDVQYLIESYKTDEGLIEGINDIVRKQQERESKLKLHKTSSKVLSLNTSEESEIIKELKALRLDVNEIKRKQGSGTEQQSKRKNKCDNCQGRAGKCSHCWACGGTGHFMYRCPLNEDRSLEGNQGAQ